MKAGYLVVLLVVSAWATAIAAGPEAVRRIQGGAIRGELQADGSALFRRIPFAAAPTGSLRWQPPQPVAPWPEVRDVNGATTPCPQLDEKWNAADVARSQEDCLVLAVREPRHAAGERLPVFVWIHGGSNRAGSGGYVADSPIYKRGVVVVGIEYRLGIFGFLASPELSKESAHHASGNYALLDQVAALEWVRANIAQFGGDPRNVTIGGQSAGAVDIAQLLRVPLARGLFAKAILESGALGPPRTAAQNEAIGSSLLEMLGRPKGAPGLAALRSMPVEDLLDAGAKLKSPTGVDSNILWLESSADGWVMPVGANSVDRQSTQVSIPMIVGNNTQEFVFDGSAEQARQMVLGFFGEGGPRALKLYSLNPPESAGQGAGDRGTQVLTDVMFRCPSLQLASWTIADGKQVWRYEFGIPRPGSARVEHNAELDYVFGDESAIRAANPWPPLQEYWVNFMKTGNPNGPGVPEWPELGKQRRNIAIYPNETRLGRETADQRSVCELLGHANRP